MNKNVCTSILLNIYFTFWAQVTQASCLNELNVVLTELMNKIYELLYCSFSKFYKKIKTFYIRFLFLF